MKKYCFIALLLLMLGSLAQAQQEGDHIVCRGYSTHYQVPIVGTGLNCNSRCQMIYPADSLSGLLGQPITRVTWYVEDEWNMRYWTNTFVVQMALTTESSLEGFDNETSMTTVFTGVLERVDREVGFELDVPFIYTGGNLMVNIYNTDYSPHHSGVAFKGVAAMGSSCFAYVDQGDPYWGNVTNFLPTTNFFTHLDWCGKPTVVGVNGLSERSATVVWHAMPGADHYELTCNDSTYSTYDTIYQLTGLQPGTRYEVGIRTFCHSEGASDITRIAFSTLCDPVEEIDEHFDGYNYNDVPLCWEATNGEVTYRYVGGSKKMGLYGEEASVLLPWMHQPLWSIEVDFDAYTEEATTIDVGYVDATMVNGPFHLVERVTTTYQRTAHHNVSFATCAGSDSIRVAFRHGCHEWSYLDNVRVRQRRTCAAPQGLRVDSLCRGKIMVSWDAGENTLWDVAYGAKDCFPDNATIIGGLNTNHCTIDSVEEETVYDVFVRAHCGEETSYWSRPLSAVSNGWEIPMIGSDTLTGCDYDIVHPDGRTMADSYDAGWSCLVLRAPEGSVLHLSGNKLHEFPLRIYEGEGNSGRVLFDHSEMYHVDVTSQSGGLTLYSDFDYISGDRGLFFHIDCEPWECPPVYDLELTAVGQTRAETKWGSSGDSVQHFAVSATNLTTGAVYRDITWDTAYSFTNLDAATTYRIDVRSVCGDGDTSAPMSLLLTTQTSPCAAADTSQTMSADIHSQSAMLIQPFSSDNNHILFQCIYTPQELQGISRITGVKVRTSGTGQRRNVSLYLSHTTCDAINYYIVDNTPREVWSGVIPYDSDSTYTILFDSAFLYNDYDNLLLSWMDHTGTPMGTTLRNAWQYIWDGNGVCYTLSPYPLDVAQIPQNYNLTYYRLSLIWLGNPCSAQSTCEEPLLSIEEADRESIALTWPPTEQGGYWAVDFRQNNNTYWERIVDSTNWNYVEVGELENATSYNFRVTHYCSPSDSAISIITASTQCGIQSAPFVEDFENAYMENSNYQLCWGKYGQYVDITPTTINNSVAIQFSVIEMLNSTSSYAYLVFPALESVNRLRLRLSMRSSRAMSHLIAGVMTVPDDKSTFVPIARIAPRTLMEFDEIELYFDSYTGSGNYIALLADSACRMIIDDVEVDYATNCRRPTNITLDSASATSFSLSWTSTATSYELEYGPQGFYRGEGTTLRGTGTSATVTGLRPLCNYDVYVRTHCSGGGYSEWSYVQTFSTLCSDIVALPFMEDFNLLHYGSLPPCWQGFSALSPFVTTNTDRSGNGNALLFGMNPGTTLTASASLPRLADSIPVDRLQVAFSLMSNVVARCYVGVAHDPHDPSSFKALDTIVCSASMPWHDYELPLSDYHDSGHYVTFVVVNADNILDCGVTIDNVSLEYIPTCPLPDSLSVSNVCDTAALLAWHERGEASQWMVEYHRAGESTTHSALAHSNPFRLTGLQAETHYFFRVRSICGPGDTSLFSRTSVNFTTTQPPAALPYYYDFEDAEEFANWHILSDYEGVTWVRDTADPAQGAYSLYVSADGGRSPSTLNYVFTGVRNSAPNYTAYRDIDFGPTDTNIILSFQYKYNTVGWGIDDFVLFLADPSVPVEPENRGSIYPGDTYWGPMYTLNPIFSSHAQPEWTTIQYELDRIHGVQRLVLFYYTLFADNAVQIDSIDIHISSCPRPSNFVLENVTTDSATISWCGDADASYIVAYRYNKNGAPVTLITTSTNRVTLAGLHPAADYVVEVRRICAPGDTSNSSAPFVFWTDCDTYITPDPEWVEEFDFSLGCWQQQYLYGENSWVSGPVATDLYDSIFPYSGYNFAFSNRRERGSRTLLISPTLNIHEGAYMSFAHKQPKIYSYFDTLGVYYRTSPDDSWKYITSYPRAINNWTIQSVPLPNPSDSYQVAFLSGYRDGSHTCIDSVVVHASGGCFLPQDISVMPLNGCWTATWTGYSAAYEVSCKIATEVDFPDPVTVTETSFAMPDLAPQTHYMFRVRSLCDNGATNWVEYPFVTNPDTCFTPTNCHITDIDYTSATLSWTPPDNQRFFEAICYTSSDTLIRRVEAPTVTFDNLYASTSYRTTVRTLCGDEMASDWASSIEFITPTCTPIENLQAEKVEGTANVRLSWLPESADTFQVEYGLSGFGQGEGTQIQVIGNTCTIVGLRPETDYFFYVRKVCQQGVHSVWSQGVAITTGVPDVTCAAVEGVSVEVNANSITATWSPVADAQGYEVEYGPQGFVHGTGVWHGDIHSTSFSISGIDSGSYQLYVRALCGSDNYGPYSSATPFHITTIGIDKVEQPLTIFPNPTTGEITVMLSEPLKQVIAINVVGQRKRLPLNGNRVSLAGCPQGIYILELQTPSATYHRKVIKR